MDHSLTFSLEMEKDGEHASEKKHDVILFGSLKALNDAM